MAKKKSKTGELRELQAWMAKMRTAIRDSQRELDKADKAAKELKKLFEDANKNLAGQNKKKS